MYEIITFTLVVVYVRVFWFTRGYVKAKTKALARKQQNSEGRSTKNETRNSSYSPIHFHLLLFCIGLCAYHLQQSDLPLNATTRFMSFVADTVFSLSFRSGCSRQPHTHHDNENGLQESTKNVDWFRRTN